MGTLALVRRRLGHDASVPVYAASPTAETSIDTKSATPTRMILPPCRKGSWQLAAGTASRKHPSPSRADSSPKLRPPRRSSPGCVLPSAACLRIRSNHGHKCIAQWGKRSVRCTTIGRSAAAKTMAGGLTFQRPTPYILPRRHSSAGLPPMLPPAGLISNLLQTPAIGAGLAPPARPAFQARLG